MKTLGGLSTFDRWIVGLILALNSLNLADLWLTMHLLNNVHGAQEANLVMGYLFAKLPLAVVMIKIGFCLIASYILWQIRVAKKESLAAAIVVCSLFGACVVNNTAILIAHS